MPPELSEGMDIKEWERQNAVRRLVSAQEEKVSEIRCLRERAGQLQQEQLEATLEDFGMEGNRGKQVKDLKTCILTRVFNPLHARAQM